VFQLCSKRFALHAGEKKGTIMMIFDAPGASLGVSGPARRRRSLDLAYRPFRGRLTSLFPAGAPSTARRVRPQRSDAAAANTPRPSFESDALARRFHAWSGRSGRRYVCSVFQAHMQAPLAGLPDFAEALVIAVRLENDGLRTPIAVFDSSDGGHCERARAFVSAALNHSVGEWHVHLLATDAEHRRAVKSDLERAQQPQFQAAA
jgi:hypothetical protein